VSQLTAEALGRRFQLANSQITIAGKQIFLLHPQSIDALLQDAETDPDDRLPYWAEIWPSARVLAERIVATPANRRHLLELGCGVGLVSIAAAQAGWSVLATDYYAEALEFAAVNAAQNEVVAVATRLIDWRRLPDDLGTFDLVVASDVLYERPNAALVAAALARTLSPDGLGLVTDPGRRSATTFAEECGEHGLVARAAGRTNVVEGSLRVNIDLFEVRRVEVFKK
jgi:predicted nicotinamide N-methyase